MRTTFKPIVSVMTVLAASSFTLAACTAESDSASAESEQSLSTPVDDSELTGAEISEAVPGVDVANPQGGTSNTADLSDEDNVEYTDDLNSDREDDPVGN